VRVDFLDMVTIEAPSGKIVGILLPLPSHRRDPHPRIVLCLLMLMLTNSSSRRAPYPYIAIFMLLLTVEL
jgi:hypothetical protein